MQIIMLTLEDFKKYPPLEIKLCSYCELGYSLELVAILELDENNGETGHNVYYQLIETQSDNKRTTQDCEDLKEAIDIYYKSLQSEVLPLEKYILIR